MDKNIEKHQLTLEIKIKNQRRVLLIDKHPVRSTKSTEKNPSKSENVRFPGSRRGKNSRD